MSSVLNPVCYGMVRGQQRDEENGASAGRVLDQMVLVPRRRSRDGHYSLSSSY